MEKHKEKRNQIILLLPVVFYIKKTINDSLNYKFNTLEMSRCLLYDILLPSSDLFMIWYQYLCYVHFVPLGEKRLLTVSPLSENDNKKITMGISCVLFNCNYYEHVI